MRIYRNPYCDFSKGWSKWRKIEQALRHRFGAFEVEEIQSAPLLSGQIEEAIEGGERFFIAAGGDGTVNLIVNALMASSVPKKDFILGAVGLGSSNDYHKPFRSETFVRGIPTRMNRKKAFLCDMIRIRYRNSQNQTLIRYSIINASIGITAQANALYNSRLPFVVRIKRFSHDCAVVASALKTIFSYRNIPCTLTLGESEASSIHLTNLGVIKNPHFAGGLCYDSCVKPDDGKLGVNLCAGMTKFETIKTLARLYKRQFRDQPKTHSWNVNKLSVESALPFALEMDGEVVSAQHAEFELLPKVMRCCR
jgi:diacylglycerol kinase (ATP)